MKFKLRSAKQIVAKSDKNRAVMEADGFVFESTKSSRVKSSPEIGINSLEDLLSLCSRYDESIVIDYTGVMRVPGSCPEITIYNDYLE
jgi:hypothetical protein